VFTLGDRYSEINATGLAKQSAFDQHKNTHMMDNKAQVMPG